MTRSLTQKNVDHRDLCCFFFVPVIFALYLEEYLMFNFILMYYE